LSGGISVDNADNESPNISYAIVWADTGDVIVNGKVNAHADSVKPIEIVPTVNYGNNIDDKPTVNSIGRDYHLENIAHLYANVDQTGAYKRMGIKQPPLDLTGQSGTGLYGLESSGAADGYVSDASSDGAFASVNIDQQLMTLVDDDAMENVQILSSNWPEGSLAGFNGALRMVKQEPRCDTYENELQDRCAVEMIKAEMAATCSTVLDSSISGLNIFSIGDEMWSSVIARDPKLYPGRPFVRLVDCAHFLSLLMSSSKTSSLNDSNELSDSASQARLSDEVVRNSGFGDVLASCIQNVENYVSQQENVFPLVHQSCKSETFSNAPKFDEHPALYTQNYVYKSSTNNSPLTTHTPEKLKAEALTPPSSVVFDDKTCYSDSSSDEKSFKRTISTDNIKQLRGELIPKIFSGEYFENILGNCPEDPWDTMMAAEARSIISETPRSVLSPKKPQSRTVGPPHKGVVSAFRRPAPLCRSMFPWVPKYMQCLVRVETMPPRIIETLHMDFDNVGPLRFVVLSSILV